MFRKLLLVGMCSMPMMPCAQASSQSAAVQRESAPALLRAAESMTTMRPGAQTQSVPNQSPGGTGVSEWHEPHGRYTIAIAPGWTVDDSQGNLKVTKGASWAIFETASRQGSAMDVAQREAEQMKGMLKTWEVVGQSPFQTPRHHAAAGITVKTMVPTRSGEEERIMTFAAQSAGGGNFVIVTASSLTPEAQSDQGRVMAMFNSIRFAGEQ